MELNNQNYDDLVESSCLSFNTDDYYTIVPNKLTNIADEIYTDNIRQSKSRLSDNGNSITLLNKNKIIIKNKIEEDDTLINEQDKLRNCKTANKKLVKFDLDLNKPKSAPVQKIPLNTLDVNDKRNDIETKLLAIIMRQKTGLNEDKIEELIKQDKIFIQNRATPFQRLNSSKLTLDMRNVLSNNNDDQNQSYLHTKQEESSNKNQQQQQQEPFTQPSFNQIRSSSVESTINLLSKYKVSDYYFRNINDLKYKFYLKKYQSILLCKTPVPQSTNKLFQNIEKFDISDKYKEQQSIRLNKQQQQQPNTFIGKKSLKRNSLEDSLRPMQKRDLFEKYKFISSRKFKLSDPVYQQYYEPPVLNLKFQKINEYIESSKEKSLLNNKLNKKRLIIKH